MVANLTIRLKQSNRVQSNRVRLNCVLFNLSPSLVDRFYLMMVERRGWGENSSGRFGFGGCLYRQHNF